MLRMMDDDQFPDFGALVPTALLLSVLFCGAYVFSGPLSGQDFVSAMVAMEGFGACVILPVVLAVLAGKRVLLLHTRQVGIWLDLAGVSKQQIVIGYFVRAMYQMRSILLAGLIVPAIMFAFMGSMRIILCIPEDPKCLAFSRPTVAFVNYLTLTPFYMLWLTGVYLFASAAGVFGALRIKRSAGLYVVGVFVACATLDSSLFFFKVFFDYTVPRHLLILAIVLPYLLALITIRIAKEYVWKMPVTA
jgi:hypothetical protein